MTKIYFGFDITNNRNISIAFKIQIDEYIINAKFFIQKVI